jgi:NADH:ubiquinone oxidoreductase subunit E
MLVQICVGSACHVKGAPEIIELFTKAVETHGLQDDVALAGSFCSGQCNRQGVTIMVNDEVCTGITRDNFKDFFDEKVLSVVKER